MGELSVRELPLFPLPEVVLFPQEVLPLHIFESRYRIMLQSVLETDSMFGVIKWDPNTKSMANIGCCAQIIKHQTAEDGIRDLSVSRGLGDVYKRQADTTSASAIGPIPLPTKRKIYCVLRSPHVDKDSREHFETRTHRRIIDIYSPSAKTIDALMKLDLPSGVDIEVKL